MNSDLTNQPKPAPTAAQPKTLCPECYGNGRVLSVCDDCSGTGFEITPAPTAPREYAIPDEECLPKYFKEPAPTAEEQTELPPLDGCTPNAIPSEIALRRRRRETVPYRWLEVREEQLLAALRSNREKDAQLHEWLRENGPGGWIDNMRKELAEKNAKIAELTEQRDEWETHAGNHVDRIRRLEFTLRAVSEALKEKLDGYKHESIRDFHKPIRYYRMDDVDTLFARLRSIVDGKDSAASNPKALEVVHNSQTER